MQPDGTLALLGGLSPQQFMRRHWHKKPLLVRGAIPDFQPPIPRSRLLSMAQRDDVESRLVVRQGEDWSLRRGPLPRRAIPPLHQAAWTLLVQGADGHDDAVRALLDRFRFVPDARLDDVMISFATDGGGVGPHVDSYDVFLLQAQGRRRWRIGKQKDMRSVPDVPLKILAQFHPQEEYLLEPGDMLYLPPGWAHDGVAQGECMTYSIGFRAPERRALASELLSRLSDHDEMDGMGQTLYRDPDQLATQTPGKIPDQLVAFARESLQRALAEPLALERALGELLSEPKPQVWFTETEECDLSGGVLLDRRTRMLHDVRHVFINGESYLASGRDAGLIRKLADSRVLEAQEVARLSAGAKALLESWAEAGWLRSLVGIEDKGHERG